MATGFVQRFKGKIKAGLIYTGSAATAGIWLENGAAFVKAGQFWTNAGAPVNGSGSGTFKGVAQPGDLLSDTTNLKLYQNTNTSASPTWTLIEAANGTLPNNATGALGTGAATFGLQGNISKQFSVAGVGNGADTSEDTLFTFSLPANSLASVGQEITIQAWGSVAATSATKTIKLYFGAGVTQTVTYTTTQTGNWQINAQVFKQAANVQMALMQYDALGATTARSLGNITNGAETDTSAITIKVTGTSSAATANLILCNGLVISGSN